MPLIVVAIVMALTSGCGAIHESRRRFAAVTADDAAMTMAPPGISRTAWRWRGTVHRDAADSAPGDSTRYSVVLQPDGRVEVQADCNAVEGRYAMVRSRLGIQIEPASRSACDPGSLGDEFLNDLREASNWSLRGGDLYVSVPAGRMRFSQ